MRPALSRVAWFALVPMAALWPLPAHAQTGDRFDISTYWSKNVQRLHAIGADTLGLSYGEAYGAGANVDFRVIDLPMGKGQKPALHLTGGVGTDQLVLGPAAEGMSCGEFPVIEFASGVALELPLEALVKGNAGVALRVGWDGSYMLTRTGGQSFLERSKLRVDFVRTTGALQGSTFGFGKGRDETFGYDASGGRWDVRLSVQGRVWGAPMAAAAPAAPAKPGAKPAARPVTMDGRLLWLFADVLVDTDGGIGADGLRARAGVGLDLNAFVTAVFTPLRP